MFAALLLWLLASGGGREWTLARVIAQLPPGSVHIGSSEGRLLGPLLLRDVSYRRADVFVQIGELRLDHAVKSLLGGRLTIRSLYIKHLRIELAVPIVEPGPQRITLPESLPWPTVELPLDVTVDEIAINDLVVVRGDTSLLQASTVNLRDAKFLNSHLDVSELRSIHPDGTLLAGGELGLDGEPVADLRASWTLTGASTPAARLSVGISDQALDVNLALVDAGKLQLRVTPSMVWQLNSDLDIADTARFIPESPSRRLALTLAAAGDATRAKLAATLALDEQTVRIEGVELGLIDDGATLQLNALRLLADPFGAVDISGRIDVSQSLENNPGAIDLLAVIDDLTLPVTTAAKPGNPAQAATEQARLRGRLTARGSLSSLLIDLQNGQIERGPLRADLDLAGEMSANGMRLDTFALRSPQGELSASGSLLWAPQVSADINASLRNFDPVLLLPDLPGKVSGELSILAIDEAAAPALKIELKQLSGQLRQRALAGSGVLDWRERGGSAEFDIRLGRSRVLISGDPGEPLDLDLRFAPLSLDDLLPNGSGEINANVRISGPRGAPRIAGNMTAQAVVADGITVGEATLQVDSAIDGGDRGQLELTARQIALADQEIDTLHLQASGAQGQHEVALEVENEQVRLTLATLGQWQASQWSGRLNTLTLSPQGLSNWRLDSPVAIEWKADRLRVERSCLRDADAASLCIAAKSEAGSESFDAALVDFPLQALAAAAGVENYQLEGVANAELKLLRHKGQATGQLNLRLDSGRLLQVEVESRPLLRWDAIALVGALTPEDLRVTLSGQLDEAGMIEGSLVGDSPFAASGSASPKSASLQSASPNPALQGQLLVSLPSIRALEAAIPDLANLTGALRVALEFAGSWDQPTMAGNVELTELAAEVPAAGIRLRESTLALRGDGQRLQVEGSINSGGGALRIEGNLNDALGKAPNGRFTLRGESVLVADTTQARALVSPDLQLRYSQGRLRVTGKVKVPEAAIALEQIESGVTASADVVVLDPREGETVAGALHVRAQIDVELGEKVALKGFGFDGGISGTLSINERSGRPATGRGTMLLRGHYRAYGQDLEISRGRLLFSSSALDNPGIDIRAQRKIQQVTVGIEVQGSAIAPQLSVWSEPALDQAEALSYLVLGRPLRSASAAEGAQLGQAAAALGGNLLAGKLGSRLGFDTFGVADSQALGGAAFTVGKYLSPALYLSYGISLFGSGQVVTLRYLLSEHFDVEIESGSESRAGLNYSIER
ncbi:MAG: translocation/assembly module TamB domain-containing protein [Pseudomarimonas sp.]